VFYSRSLRPYLPILAWEENIIHYITFKLTCQEGYWCKRLYNLCIALSIKMSTEQECFLECNLCGMFGGGTTLSMTELNKTT